MCLESEGNPTFPRVAIVGWRRSEAEMFVLTQAPTPRPKAIASTALIVVVMALGGCASDIQPSAPIDRTNMASVAALAADDVARFEADVINSMFIDTTGLELAAGRAGQDPERLRAFREAARRPLVSAYRFTYVDSAGRVSVTLSPPSESVVRGTSKPTLLKWDKIARITITAGAALPAITMRSGRVLVAETPREISSLTSTPDQNRVSAQATLGRPIGASQLRGMLAQYVRRTADTPGRRRDSETRDSLRRARGHSRQWQRASDALEFVARQEMVRSTKPGQPLQRIVIELQNVRTAGSADRLAGER